MYNLHAIASCVLCQIFPGLDDFQVAKLYGTVKHDTQAAVAPLSSLCKLKITSVNPHVQIENLLKNIDNKTTTETDKCELDFDGYLKNLTLHKSSVVLPKLKEEVIRLWTKEHWSFLNPYSDIEEDIPTAQTLSVKSKSSEDKHDEPSFGGHDLRCRKRNYMTARLRRSSTCHQYYRGMCAENTPAKKATIKHSDMKSPSHTRLSAQWKITLKKTMRKIGIDVNARLTRSYPLF